MFIHNIFAHEKSILLKNDLIKDIEILEEKYDFLDINSIDENSDKKSNLKSDIPIMKFENLDELDKFLEDFEKQKNNTNVEEILIKVNPLIRGTDLYQFSEWVPYLNPSTALF